jgi:hypothetical protein
MAWLERDQRRLWLVSGLGYLLLCWLAFFQNLGSLSLMDKTEALFVEVGRQMVSGGTGSPRSGMANTSSITPSGGIGWWPSASASSV